MTQANHPHSLPRLTSGKARPRKRSAPETFTLVAGNPEHTETLAQEIVTRITEEPAFEDALLSMTVKVEEYQLERLRKVSKRYNIHYSDFVRLAIRNLLPVLESPPPEIKEMMVEYRNLIQERRKRREALKGQRLNSPSQ